MLYEKIKGIGMIALLSLSIFAVSSFGALNGPLRLQDAAAAGETISLSKATFFGSNVVQVTITDDNLKDNNDGAEQDELSVSFDVRSGSDSLIDDVTVGDDAGDVSAEIGDSGKFVFYVTADANVTETDLEDSEFGTDSQIVYVTEGGDIDIGTDASNDALDGATDGISLNEGATITITYKDASAELTYEDAKADITLDRTTVGSDGFVYLKVTDQDANDDPTGRDDLNFDNTLGNLTMTYTGVTDNNLGQAIADTPGLHFLETSDNSGIFEVRLSVNDIFDLQADDTPKSVKIEMQDFQVYPNDQFYDADEAGVPGDDDTPESVTVDNSDGLLQDVTNPASPRSELAVKVFDPDRNLDSKVKDRIPKSIAADLSSSGTADDEPIATTPVDLIETGVNTGIFVPDLANNVFEVTIGPAHVHDGIVQIDSAASAKSDLLVRYADFTPDADSDRNTAVQGGSAKIILFKGKAAANTPAVVSLGQTRIGPQDKVFLVINDPDLNDDKNGIDSFDLTIDASSFDDGELTVGSVPFNSVDIADLKLDSIINGQSATDANPTSDITVSFQETGKDTSIFEAEFDYELIASSANTKNGDNTEFTWVDQLLDSPLESKARLTINQASKSVQWQQNEYAAPYAQEDRGTDDFNSDIDAKRTRIKLLITDPSLNRDASTVETKTFSILDDPGTTDLTATGFPDLAIKLVGADGHVLLKAIHNEIDACGGMSANTTFTETGANTGIFDKTFDFKAIAGTCNLDPEELVNARLVADYKDSTASTVLKGYNGILTSSSKTINSGQEITITVSDPDQNHDRDVKEQVLIEIEPDGLDKIPILLDETDLNTGIFTKKLVVGEDFKILDDDKVVDDVTVTYNDAVTSSGSTAEERELKLIPPTSNGQLTITPDINIGPATKITITLVDADLNEDPNTKDLVDFDALKIRTTNNDISHDEIKTGQDGLRLEETDNNSGTFKLTMTLVPITPEQKHSGDDITFVASGDKLDFPAEPSDTIAITYSDENHDKGRPDSTNVIIHVMSFDPVISTDKEAYLPGDTMIVTIQDADADRDPDIIDVIADIQVSSDRDAVGESFDAVETGPNTGIFTVQVPIVEEPESDAIAAEIGDTLTIKYTDDFPAGYDPDDEDDKDFTYTVKVGKIVEGGVEESTSPSAPSIKDIVGKQLDQVNPGQQVILSTTIANNLDKDQQFAAIIEVRDSSGITVFLAWQTGKLNSDDEAEVGLSWTPNTSGQYTIRTFVVSDLANPDILSDVQETKFSVS